MRFSGNSWQKAPWFWRHEYASSSLWHIFATFFRQRQRGDDGVCWCATCPLPEPETKQRYRPCAGCRLGLEAVAAGKMCQMELIFLPSARSELGPNLGGSLPAPAPAQRSLVQRQSLEGAERDDNRIMLPVASVGGIPFSNFSSTFFALKEKEQSGAIRNKTDSQINIHQQVKMELGQQSFQRNFATQNPLIRLVRLSVRAVGMSGL